MFHQEFMVRERHKEYQKEITRYHLISLARRRTASSKNFNAPALSWLGTLLSR
jgi:hypothetical protein